jgi:microcystin degradation protein MlrC
VLFDPEAVKECTRVGEGGHVFLRVGAKTDHEHGAPVAIEGTVLRLHDGHFVEENPRHGGTRDYDQGKTAVIQTIDGHTVVVNSLRVMPTSLEQLLSLGINPRAMGSIIVKGVTAPRAAYDPIATKTICVDTPGVTRAGPEAFQYHKRPHPLYPLDTQV